MKHTVTLLLVTLLLFLPLAAFAQSGGKTGGDEAAAALPGDADYQRGGKNGEPGVAKSTPTAAEVASEAGAPPAVSEDVAVGSDANQAVQKLADPVDPTGDPAGFLDKLVTWWKAGWFLPFGFLIALGIVTYAARYLPWIASTPQRALAIAAVSAFLGDCVARLGTGGPINFPIIMAAIGTGIGVWMSGNKAAGRSAVGTLAKFGPPA